MASGRASSSVPGAGTTPRRALDLSPRQSALLAYSAGWLSGALVLWLEPADRTTRWHAAQAFLGFGALALLGVFLLALAGVGLLVSLTVFRVGLWAVQALVAIGVLVWVWTMVTVALGGRPRFPLIGARVDRLAG